MNTETVIAEVKRDLMAIRQWTYTMGHSADAMQDGFATNDDLVAFYRAVRQVRTSLPR